MHVIVNRQQISQYTQALERVTGKQLNLDVLRCILLEARRETLVLRATNLDIGIEVIIQAETKKEGTVAVPAPTLSGFLENTAGDTIELSQKEGGLLVSSKTARATLTILSHEDFPILPRTKGVTVSISQEKLASGLRAVWYAAATSTMKPELSSISVASDGDLLVFAATDSFRLAEKRVQLGTNLDLPTLLIPVKNTGEIIRTLEQAGGGEASVTASDNQVSIVCGDVHITSRLVDGTFPDYKQIVPKEHATEVTVLKQDLVQALKVSSVFVNKFNQVTFSIHPKQKTFSVDTAGGDTGESSVALDAALSGEPVQIGFNQKYITDSFQSIGDDSVTLKLSGPGKPMVIRGTGDATFTYLTMPMSR